MPKVSQAFSGKYLTGADIGQTQPTWTVESYAEEQMQDGSPKWVLYFVEEQKALVLNRTNASMLASLFGDDFDDWIGQRVGAFSVPVNFNGKITESIRLRSAPKKKVPAPRVTPADLDGDDLPDNAK